MAAKFDGSVTAMVQCVGTRKCVLKVDEQFTSEN